LIQDTHEQDNPHQAGAGFHAVPHPRKILMSACRPGECDQANVS